MSTEAERLLRGDRDTATALAAALLIPRADNLVARPWGGTRLRELKNLGADGGPTGPIGESFELAADDSDAEARQYPSLIPLTDGSSIALPALLAVHGETLLGADFVRRYGGRFPLLPKLLDVRELLSVQAHPPGNTEVYVILAAEPGATIHLGFCADVDGAAYAARLAAGRREQQRLLEWYAGSVSPDDLQGLLKPWFATRGASASDVEPTLRPRLPSTTPWVDVAECLAALHAVYWYALESLNAIPVAAGQVLYNANPSRVVAATGQPASAEVHALGNPEGRAVLALEIRRPGTTFRAWDNVRFPVRAVDIDAALRALNLRATTAADFIVTPRALRPGVQRSVDCVYFRVEHLRPTAIAAIDIPATPPHSLHALDGAVSVYATDGVCVGRLARGESALVPIGVGAYRVVADREPAELVKVELPPYAD